MLAPLRLARLARCLPTFGMGVGLGLLVASSGNGAGLAWGSQGAQAWGAWTLAWGS